MKGIFTKCTTFAFAFGCFYLDSQVQEGSSPQVAVLQYLRLAGSVSHLGHIYFPLSVNVDQCLKTTMLFFLFFTFVLHAGKHTQGCEIKFHPLVEFLKFGGSVTVNCRTSSCNNTVGIGWESSNGGTGLVEGVSNLDLKIDGVTDWNIEPKCYIVFSDDTQKIQNLPITIYKMPEKVSMPKPTSPMKATGEYYLLQCNVVDVAPANRLTISWYKGNEMIYERNIEDPRQSPVSESFQTTVQILPEDHGKEVWCEAKLNLTAEQSPPPMRSESHVLTVFYPPTFIEPNNETLEISTGTKISLNCTATGNPTPVYSWHFADPTQEGIQNEIVNGPNLTLDFRVSGVFRCTASNVVGERTKYFNLKTPQGNQTTLAAILGVFLTLGALIFIGGVIFVTQTGSCSFQKGNYQPTASGPL